MVVFVSNYINHHQLPFCRAMLKECQGDFVFVETEPMEEERRNMGWGVQELPEFVISYEKEKEKCDKLFMDADHVIFGGARDEEIIQPRLQAGKPTIRYSESIYKEGQWKFLSPRGLKKKYHDHGQFRKSPAYLLCAGAFVAGDYSLIHAYPDKKYTWGYFPEVIVYDDLASKKKDAREEILRKYEIKIGEEAPLLLWTGRQITWKRPEMMVALAAELRELEADFHLIMVGEGPYHNTLQEFVQKEGLEKQVTFLPFVLPEEVRQLMLASDFYFMTSTQEEGWGAVVNEAMNSGCVVVGSSTAGAVPTLIRDQVSGLVFDGRRPGTMVSTLVSSAVWGDKTARREMGEKAYHYMKNVWNPSVAAKVLYAFMTSGYQLVPAKGPLSKAVRIFPSQGLAYTRRHMTKDERRLRKRMHA